MKNSTYWKLRFQQLEAAQNQKGAAAYQEIEKQYRQAQREIEGKINTWYQRFADNNGITFAEARQYLKSANLKEFQWDVWDYIRYGQENAINQNWMKELENASAKYHISKLEALKIQTQQSLEVMFSKQMGITMNTMKDVFQTGYYHTAFEIQTGFHIGWDIAGLDQRQIEKVISKPWAVDGKNFSERIWGNKEKLIKELHTELTQMVMLGNKPQKAMHSITKKMNTSKQNAGRLVMTEAAYFSSAAQKDCFEDLGVEQYEIVATLDSHTSKICQNLDGKHFPMKDYEAGVTAPPFHVYCRSTTAPYFEEDFGDIGERAAREEETGKTYYIPENMNYKEWEEKFVTKKKKSEKPQVVSQPIFNDKRLQASYLEFMEVLKNSNGEKNLVNLLKNYANTTKYRKDNSNIVFRYHRKEDIILYNPNLPYFEEYDMLFVQAHELSHRADALKYHSWENQEFKRAIENTKEKVYDYKDKVKEWFSFEDSLYGMDMALSDIISAVSLGDFNEFLYVGHDKAYWENNPDYVAMELFANIASIDVMDYDSKAEFHGLLEELYEAYKELVNENENHAKATNR